MPEPDIQFPKSIDVNITAKCNLRCTFCWGPHHDIPDGLSGEEWCDVLEYFYHRGTRSVVFTGGEPLVRKDAAVIIRAANDIGYRVTLSTNGILLGAKLKEVGPSIRQIGLPLDGPDALTHARMRIGAAADKSFSAAIEAMKATRRFNRDIEITVRTVVSKVNFERVPEIAGLLEMYSDYWDRWKVYQFIPAGIGDENRPEHDISLEEFDRVCDKIGSSFSDGRVQVQRAEDRAGRYFFVGPEGDFFTSGNIAGYRGLGSWADLKSGRTEEQDLMATAFDSHRNSNHGS